MKQRLHTHAALWLAALALLLGACTQESPVAGDGRTATLRLNVPLLEQAGTRAARTDDENAIHTLRVVIVQGQSGTNHFFNDVTPDQPLTIEGVPVGTVQMYVIANEAALGKDYTDLATLYEDLVQVSGHNHDKLLVKDEERTHFPKRGSEFDTENQGDTPKGLPMSWQNQSLQVLPPADGADAQNVTVELKRAVAKLNIQMENTLTDAITVQTVSFGRFFANSLFLFQESALDVPGEEYTAYKEQVYENLSIQIPAGKTQQLVCYLYPSQWISEGPATASPYTIGMKTAKRTYTPTAFVDDSGLSLGSIARNTQVNVHIRLGKNANVRAHFTVEDWTVDEVEVPGFN